MDRFLNVGNQSPRCFFFFFGWGTMCVFVYEWLYECVSLTLIQTVDSSALTFTSCLPKALGENLELSQILGHTFTAPVCCKLMVFRFLVIYQSFSKAQWASHSPEFHFFSLFQVFNKPCCLLPIHCLRQPLNNWL